MWHRLLPLLLIIAAVLFVSINFQTIRRDLAYKLHLSGDPTTSCCKEEEVLKATGEFDEQAVTAIFDNQIINYPKTSLSVSFDQSLAVSLHNEQVVLGTTTADGQEKWIEVSLVEQKLRAWEGNRIAQEFLISSGKWTPTPKGTFYIWHKTRSQAMSGGSRDLGTYYFLPNVPNNMFFYKGYAIHGAYWHNNFGQPMSHGCVNSPLAAVAQLFDWTGPVLALGRNVAHATLDNPGTKVYVH